MNIPNFENVQFVDRNGYLTEPWQLILQSLLTQLQKNAGSEGLVAPTQTTANITTIAANQNASGAYTAQFGTILYDSSDQSMRVIVDNGSGVPTVKTFTLT